MSRYFFHTESDYRHSDTTGVDLADLEAARCEAAILAGDVLRESPRKFWGTQPWTLTVTDEVGLILFTVEMHAQESPAAVRH